MALSDQEKFEQRRERMLAKFREYTIGTAKNKVATDFQRMIRAEAAAEPAGLARAVVDGTLDAVWRETGECVCITCGLVGWWCGNSVGGGAIETGHFIASRGASIVFELSNANPQCKRCNRNLSGNQANYRIWMEETYGPEETERLARLKHTQKQFTREELVDLRLIFMERVKIAERRIEEAK